MNKDYKTTPAIRPAEKPTGPTIPMSNNAKDSHDADVKKMATEIKKTWPKLTDAEIAMYNKQPDTFFDALKSRHSVAKEDAVKKIKEFKVNCGCSNTAKAA